jgi:hypothetical protein
MVILAGATFLLALQQGVQITPGNTSPPSGDTVGYWQQRVAYTITATLDEPAQRVRALGTLLYVNNSPETLREMYVHQYLNAFRPGSKWSEVDEREGRVRFQYLPEPHFGYERFTAPVRVNGAPVAVEYPGAPDSTVARFTLPTPLAPGDSVVVALEWEARPSTLPRRQGRRGRHWDLAQWYPKVAVYDRGGWQINALQPAGEFYGEFGTYDVMLYVAQDQVVGATGVPVLGDPGWSRVLRSGVVASAAPALVERVPARSVASPPPAGMKHVRFYARDVHHFAWSASPDYRYEGAAYVSQAPRIGHTAWDTVAIHVLYRPGDDTTWGGQRVVRRTITAMRWLESIYGRYTYPQMTVLHRLDGGGTEFPMMQMNGSASQGLILHEGGHVWTYGILANNEWRSGWMDEGLTSYQTDWAQLATPQERLRAGVVDQPVKLPGYRGRAVLMALPRFERMALGQTTTDLLGGAEPIGTTAHEFRDFATYNDMIYTRAEIMYSQLRDVLGDSLFADFLRDYYGRWALKHVDERAMRASAERVSRRNLGWFFEQWVHRTGIVDYQLGSVTQSRDSTAAWITAASVRRRGEYRHPISVGVRTTSGWTLARLDEPYDRQTLRIRTREEPLEVRLDPYHFSWDWDRRNDIRRPGARQNFDWPFLAQADRERPVLLYRPMAWYSDAGGANVGLRQRMSYLGWLDQFESGIVAVTRDISDSELRHRLQVWVRNENPQLPFMRRPAIGWRYGVAVLDDVNRFEIGRRRAKEAADRARFDDVAFTFTAIDRSRLLPELWSREPFETALTADLDVGTRWLFGSAAGSHWFVQPRFVVGVCRKCRYAKLEGSLGGISMPSEDSRIAARVYVGEALARGASDLPSQRSLLLSAEDPISSFNNHWWRPRGAILKRPGVHWLPLGGAALRGFDWIHATDRIAATNVELSKRVGDYAGAFGRVSFWTSAFAEAGHTWFDSPQSRGQWLGDAGVGLNVRGRFYDQPITLRFDFPIYVSRPELAIDRGRSGSGRFAPRWVMSFNDIW